MSQESRVREVIENAREYGADMHGMLILEDEISALRQDNIDLVSALAECRDAVPDFYASTETAQKALEDPLAVPAYVKEVQKALEDQYHEMESDKEDADAFSGELVGAILHLTGNDDFGDDEEFSVGELVDMLECWKKGRDWGWAVKYAD